MSPAAAVILFGVNTNDLAIVGDPTTTVMIFPAGADADAWAGACLATRLATSCQWQLRINKTLRNLLYVHTIRDWRCKG